MSFLQRAVDLIVGLPWGSIYPKRPTPQLSPIDGRTAALHVLRRYISELEFMLPGAVGAAPTPFHVPEKDIYIEQPDNVTDAVLPSIAILSGKGECNVIGLGNYIDEKSYGVFAPGTALQVQFEHHEMITVEVWASKRAERRSLLAGLEVAFVPTEFMYGVRFRMPEYYFEPVCFTLNWRQPIDDAAEVARNRRKATLELEMRFNVVVLVNVGTLAPQVTTEAYDLRVMVEEGYDVGPIVRDP